MGLVYLLSFPELLITIGALIILMLSTFLKNNSYKIAQYLSVFLLIITFCSVLIYNDNTYLNYQFLFLENLFINTLKILIILSSIFCLLIINYYFKDLKIERFEIPILLLFSVLGMMVMVSSNNLMSMYLGIELQSLSLYVVATIQRNSLKSSEAGLKYFILGALSSGLLLYGCSLIYGFTGSSNFNEIKTLIENSDDLNLGIIFGLVFVITSLGFKVSAAPFHMWTPDVYEGSPTPITAFFTLAPKIAAVGLLIRFLIEPFGSFWNDWKQIIFFLSTFSMIIGALAAIMQTNIKRLLAYSSIGHIGYILIGLASGTVSGISAILIYLFIYIFMNISLFAIILSLKINDEYIEKINHLSGLNKKYPLISIVIAIMMFSMVGIPPFAGFFAKFYIFLSALESQLYVLAIIGVISSVVAAFYYIRIIKIIYFDELSNDDYQLYINFKSKVIILVSTVIVTFFIIYPSPIIAFFYKVSKTIF